MTQKEIIEFEEANTAVIRLYLEGTFYKAYERSAFAFCTRIKDYKVLRKESKTLGRDILYLGFPMAALDKTLGGAMTRKVSEAIIDVVLSYPISVNEFLQWRDAQEVEQASRALISPYTKVIEKSPVYKTAYDILTQVILISDNISKNCQTPFGTRMKELSYRTCYIVRCLYDLNGEQRAQTIAKALPLYDELAFLLQLMKDRKQISLNSFALLSEQIISVSKQLSILQRKATGPVPAE
ncbi:MAG: hypothetical protein MJY76_00010 [Bacteroidales bacterium]|nr:hypothetical protein [Bacteroidales bacterium]